MTNTEINTALAKRMGYTVRVVSDAWQEHWKTWRMFSPNGENVSHCNHTTEAEAWADAPDFCTDPAASRELVEWLSVSQETHISIRFIKEVAKSVTDPVGKLMIVPPETIARAACEALRIEE